MRIRRIISIYNVLDDSLVREYEINHIPIIKLKRILDFELGDPELLQVHKINDSQLIKLAKYVPGLIASKSPSVEFFYECFKLS